ncbi:MAG: tetratricopeptide repeat protein [Pontiella sp.]
MAGTVLGGGEEVYELGMDAYPTNTTVAYELFIKAAGEGAVEAMMAAGYCCEHGAGVVESRGTAHAWHRIAIEKDSIAACRGMAAMDSLYHGIREKDLTERRARFEKHAQDVDSAYTYVLQLLVGGRQAEAEDMLERAIVKFDPSARMLFARGVMARSRWDKASARIYFIGVQAVEASGPLTEIADAVIRMDEEKEVTEGFRVLIRLMNDYRDNQFIKWLFAIQCREQKKNSQGGAAAFEEVLAAWKPGPVMIHHTYANLLTEKLGRTEDALPHRLIAVEQAERPWTCQGLANTLNSLERYEEAEPWYAKAVELNSEYYKYWYQWGVCLLKLGCYADAEKVFRKAEQLNPENTSVRSKLLTCLIECGNYAEVVSRCEKLLVINPNNRLALKNLARLYAEGLGVEKDLEKAERFRTKSGHPTPARPYAPRPEGGTLFLEAQKYSLGQAGQRRDKVKALELYMKSYAANDTYKDKAAYAIGSIYARGGGGVSRSRQLALEWYRKALDAGSERACGGMIEIYLSPRNPAERDLEKALEFALQARGGDTVYTLSLAARAYAQAER